MSIADYFNKCDKCGADLDESVISPFIGGERLCNKCRTKKLTSEGIRLTTYDGIVPPTINVDAGFTLQGAAPTVNLDDPAAWSSTSGTIEANIGRMADGLIDWPNIGTVDPRDEQMANLKAKVEELERSDSVDKETIGDLKKRFAELEVQQPPSKVKRVISPKFETLCEILTLWIPRRLRVHEETYKAELSERLSHSFLYVKEEADGQLCDILVAKKYAVHLKINPNKSQYDTLYGQISRTLENYKQVACVIIGIPSNDLFQDFKERATGLSRPGKVRIIPKAR